MCVCVRGGGEEHKYMNSNRDNYVAMHGYIKGLHCKPVAVPFIVLASKKKEDLISYGVVIATVSWATPSLSKRVTAV